MPYDSDLAVLGMGLLRLQAKASAPEVLASWIKRRVQRLEFLDTRAVRWRVSVDFVVPDDAPILKAGDQELRLVPVATLEKRNLIAFSLHDEHSVALPLPTSLETTNRLRDALTYWAIDILGKELQIPETLPGDLFRIIHDLPADLRTRPPSLLAAARLMDAEAIVASWRDRRESATGKRERRAAERELAQARAAHDSAMRNYETALGALAGCERTRKAHAVLLQAGSFRSQVGELSENFVVHVGLTSPPGTRRIVKLTYESDIRFSPPEKMNARLRQLLGWRCWQVAVKIGGRGGSHHLQVAAPPGVDIVGIAANPVDPPAKPASERLPRSLWQRVSTWDPPAAAKVWGCSPNVQLSPPDGAFTRYQAAIYVRVSRPGWLTGSWLIALVIAGVILTGRLRLEAVFAVGDQGQAGTAATLLLALLGVFATLLVGPGAHPLAARLLLAARVAIAADVLAILIAVGNLVLHQSSDPMPKLLWTGLSAISLLVGIILTVSRFLPVARRPHLE